MTFFRQIGSTIGLAAMGSVFNSAYPSAFRDAIPAAVSKVVPPQVIAVFNNPQVLLQPEAQAQLHQQFGAFGPQGLALLNALLESVKVGIASSLHSIFFLGMIVAVASVVAVLFLKEIPLRGEVKPSAALAAEGMAEVAGEPETPEAAAVVQG
jgi:hypothetical protein